MFNALNGTMGRWDIVTFYGSDVGQRVQSIRHVSIA